MWSWTNAKVPPWISKFDCGERNYPESGTRRTAGCVSRRTAWECEARVARNMLPIQSHMLEHAKTDRQTSYTKSRQRKPCWGGAAEKGDTSPEACMRHAKLCNSARRTYNWIELNWRGFANDMKIMDFLRHGNKCRVCMRHVKRCISPRRIYNWI